MPTTLATASRFLQDHYGPRAGPPRALAAGAWSRAFAFRLDGRPSVVRFGAYRDDFAKDQLMGACAADAALPIPRVFEIGDAAEGYFAVSERAYGRHLDDLPDTTMRALLPALFSALDTFRSVDVSGSKGFGLWGPGRTAPYASWRDMLVDVANEHPWSRVRGWLEPLRTSPLGMEPFALGFRALSALADGLPESRHLIHADLLHSNVLVKGHRITAILDWGNALYGDWLYDAAWLLYCWRFYPAWTAIDIRAELEKHWAEHGGRPADVDHRLACYQLHIGLSAQAYNAFRRDWDGLRQNGAHTLELVRSL